MNIFLLIAIGVMLSSNAAQADGVEPDMRDPKLPPIKSISIRENAARSPAASGSEEQCGGFVLTIGEVKDYLLAAREVTQDDYLHMLDWSPCYASGDVLFENGMTGVWGIQQLRAGSLSLSSGRKIYLYCPHCRSRSFEPRDRRQAAGQAQEKVRPHSPSHDSPERIRVGGRARNSRWERPSG